MLGGKFNGGGVVLESPYCIVYFHDLLLKIKLLSLSKFTDRPVEVSARAHIM